MTCFNIDQLPVGLLAQLVRALHRYRRGQEFESDISLNFFSGLSFGTCISNYNNSITKSKGRFSLSRNFQVLVRARKFHTRK